MNEELKKLREITETLTQNGYLVDQTKEWEFAFNAMPDAIFVINTDYRIKFANAALLELMNKSKLEILDKPCFEVIHNSAMECDCNCNNDLTRETCNFGEYQIDSLGGWFDFTRSPIFDEKDNRLLGYICILKDVTGEHLAKSVVSKREAFLKSIYKASPVGFGVVQKPGRRLVWVNDKIAEMLGYTKEELEGKSARILYPSNREYDRVGAIKYSEIEEKGVSTLETKWQTKDGRVLDILLSSTALAPTEFGVENGITFTALDISNAKANELKYKDMFDSAPVAIYEVDFNTQKFVDVNETMCRASGYSRKELLAMGPKDILTKDSYELFLRRLKNLGEGREVPKDVTYTVVHRDGSMFNVEIHVNFIYQAGLPVGAHVMARKIRELCEFSS